MKIIFYITILFVLACKSKNVSVTNDGILASPKDVNWEVKMFSVFGNVTYSQSYCGGARPTDEVLMEITSPKPMVNSTFYVRQGKENNPELEIFFTFKTDDKGNFNFTLPPGDYVIIEQNRTDSSYYHSVLKTYGKETNSNSAADTTCMKKWLAGCLAQFTVADSDLKNINWDMHTSCFINAPCVHYKGPYPP